MPRTEGSNRSKSSSGGGAAAAEENTSYFMFTDQETDTSEAANNYVPINGNLGIVALANEINVQQIVCRGGKMRNLYAAVKTAPGNGKSWTITFRVNGVNSALTCTISNAATTANDTTHEVDVTAGDLLSVEWAPSGTPTDPDIIYNSMEFVIA